MVSSLLRDLRAYYHGSRGRDQAQFYDLESSLPYFDHVNRILGRDKQRLMLEFLGAARPGAPLLEVGCGIGTFARVLTARGERVLGLDISPRKVARARLAFPAAGPGQAEYRVGDLRDLGRGGALDGALLGTLESWGLAGGSLRFSRIVASDVVEHVPSDPAATAARLRELLLAGGQLVVSVPSRLCLGDPGHIWRLTPGEWESVFRAAGFGVLRRRMSRVCWYRLWTPLPLAMVFDLRREDP